MPQQPKMHEVKNVKEQNSKKAALKSQRFQGKQQNIQLKKQTYIDNKEENFDYLVMRI